MTQFSLNQQNIAISGSWRTVSAEVEQDVRTYVKWAILSGHAIITGGALGVDAIATDEALRLQAKPYQLTVWLPTPLDVYLAHFATRAEEGVITHAQSEALAAQLRSVEANNRIHTLNHSVCTEETYYERNTKVLEDATRLAAFHVNGSGGVHDTIDKARARNLQVDLKTYTIPRAA